jgi:hypothetical protein
MPKTAFSMTRSGCLASMSRAAVKLSWPMYPVCLKYFLFETLRPVSFTLAALTTTTKSPPSMCGVNVGLCLPLMSWATALASRPSGTPVASTTCHS